MNTFEQLEEQACKDGIDIIERKFNSERIKGLYCSGNIALSDKLETSAEKPASSRKNWGITIQLSEI